MGTLPWCVFGCGQVCTMVCVGLVVVLGFGVLTQLGFKQWLLCISKISAAVVCWAALQVGAQGEAKVVSRILLVLGGAANSQPASVNVAAAGMARNIMQLALGQALGQTWEWCWQGVVAVRSVPVLLLQERIGNRCCMVLCVMHTVAAAQSASTIVRTAACGVAPARCAAGAPALLVWCCCCCCDGHELRQSACERCSGLQTPAVECVLTSDIRRFWRDVRCCMYHVWLASMLPALPAPMQLCIRMQHASLPCASSLGHCCLLCALTDCCACLLICCACQIASLFA